ncbi:MAG: sugar transporter [Rhizobiales bacterium 24-66-13]|uniref:polysaccharide biosynthesis/export family protein n=1 Tax=Roseixanthobacter finlandensis TaxID=3119922 RepID=UPI000BDC209A|nr:MAG: sugar transporter [Rhizobiales bacterium 24-66-13]OZB00506.1 MAG: sugar transporter [Rhizobiales bacterium 39-66-18]HQS47772.1 polysaccharide biosynthesis/export family protein [Xanthobacteraceae bacterium]
MPSPACEATRRDRSPELGAPRGRSAGPWAALRLPVFLLLGSTVLAGCTTTSGRTPLLTGQELSFTQVNPEGFRPWTPGIPAYRIGPGDKLKVKFSITREMDEDLVVSPDGTIGLRAVGQIRVEGMTLAGLQETIRVSARRELTDQRVVVSLEDSGSSKVYVGGSVAHPGLYKIAEMRVSSLEAVLLAGGFTDEARLGEVALIRRDPSNRAMLKIINLRDMIQTGSDEADVPLVAGDILYVPRSDIAELNLWIDQFINKVVPFQRTFSYTLGAYSTTSSGASTLIP